MEKVCANIYTRYSSYIFGPLNGYTSRGGGGESKLESVPVNNRQIRNQLSYGQIVYNLNLQLKIKISSEKRIFALNSVGAKLQINRCYYKF